MDTTTTAASHIGRRRRCRRHNQWKARQHNNCLPFLPFRHTHTCNINLWNDIVYNVSRIRQRVRRMSLLISLYYFFQFENQIQHSCLCISFVYLFIVFQFHFYLPPTYCTHSTHVRILLFWSQKVEGKNLNDIVFWYPDSNWTGANTFIVSTVFSMKKKSFCQRLSMCKCVCVLPMHYETLISIRLILILILFPLILRFHFYACVVPIESATTNLTHNNRKRENP